jgi:sugar phosphate isomerase/epimerase
MSLLALAATATSAAEKSSPSKIIGFIKPFQKLPFDQIADTAREAGWSGIECPLRNGGAVEPTRVEDDLPKLIEALRQRELDISVISTDIEDATDPLTQRVLKTASKLGVRRYRMKHYYYDLNKPLPRQLENFRAKLRDLAQLNRELNIQGSIQNHSGRNYVGAPVWDIYELIRDLDPKSIGIFFDIGHATIEGGYSWPIDAKLVEPRFSVISVKDFTWARTNGSWRAEWCPLGQGMIRPDFFKSLRQSSFNGPITIQFEYDMGTGKDMIAAMRKDLDVLKKWLQL